ncbi:beta-glucosidase [Granulicella rosea]|nr:glycoside hydrolase family 3 C-terminal domain-containing protein [Granulicella rosea]
MLGKMSLAEKLSLLGGHDMETSAAPSVGLRALRMSDGPMGIKGKEPANAMPGGVCLASTWNPGLAHAMGTVLGEDARARGVDILLGPGVNLLRFPVGGRNFEYFSEDPKLTAAMAVPYIQGVQEQGVVATVKHFAANNSEFDRHGTNALVDERALRELYLPAFEAAVRQGHVGAVMTSYNLIGGEHASQNRTLVHDVLESEWKFDGVVMSDWGSTYDGVAAARAGLGIEMPWGKHMNAATLEPALHDGRLSETEIDDKVRRILRMAIRFGLADRPALRLDIPRFRPEALDVARRIAEEGIVLLKNDRSVLPFGDDVKSVAVLGPNAFPLVASGGGSSHVGGWSDVSVVEALGGHVKVFYDRGISAPEEIFAKTEFRGGLKREVFANGSFTGVAQVSRVNRLEYATGQRASSETGAQRSVRWSGDYVASHASEYLAVLGTDAHDRCELFVNGQRVLEALAHEIVSPPTWGRVYLPQGASSVKLECATKLLAPEAGLGLIAVDEAVHPEGLALAAKADAVVLAVGFDNATEFEGMDRTFALPVGQDELIHAVAAVNKRTVVALTGGGNVAMSGWIDRTPGLLQVWYPGEQGGFALSEVLLGKVNPSGKLPVSFEKELTDNPAAANYYPKPGSPDVRYAESVFMGYRYYTSRRVEPRFPFGFGLSYTQFGLSDLKLDRTTTDGTQTIGVSVTVKNEGKRRGAEVLQVYVGCPSTQVERPLKELRAFQKVDLGAGESSTVHLALTERDFAYYGVSQHRWVTEDGLCRVMVGNSSTNTPLDASFAIHHEK